MGVYMMEKRFLTFLIMSKGETRSSTADTCDVCDVWLPSLAHGRRNFRRSRRNPVPVPLKLPSTKAPATTLRTTGKMTASSGFRNTQGVSDIYSFSKRKTSKSTPSNANIPQGTALKVKTTALIKENDNTSRNNSVNITRPAPSEASNVKISGNDNIANYSGQYKGQSHNKTWVRFLRTISEVSMSTH